MLAFKSGVRIRPSQPVMRYLLEQLDYLSEREDVCEALAGPLTITSANDSTHSTHSRHYADEALDLRAHNVVEAKRLWLRELLDRQVNAPFDRPRFTVLYEHPGSPNVHYHVQVVKGTPSPWDQDLVA